MVRFSSIVLVYFICGAVMFGGGAISLDEAGIVGEVVDPAGDTIKNSGITDRLNQMGGPISNIIGTVGGGLLAVWNFVKALITFTFWPVETLWEAGAPLSVTILIGGTLTMAFIIGLVQMVRGSA